MSKQFRDLIKYEFGRHNNLNIVLERTIPYEDIGRVQTETEAKAIDDAIIKVLDDSNYEYTTTPSCPHAADRIFKITLERLKDDY